MVFYTSFLCNATYSCSKDAWRDQETDPSAFTSSSSEVGRMRAEQNLQCTVFMDFLFFYCSDGLFKIKITILIKIYA